MIPGFTMAVARSSSLALLAIVAMPAAAAGVLRDIPTPFIPSTPLNVDEMLRLAGTGPQDVVYDLGSGDGRIVISAARDYGARGVGIELDAGLVAESNENARRADVAGRVEFRNQDVFAADIRRATVVTLYLLPSLVEKLKPKLLRELRPGTRIVAHEYGFEDWKPDRRVKISKTYLLYVVPARAAGTWRLQARLPDGARDYEFTLEQRYQEIEGGARVAGGYLPAFEARLAGDRLSFVLVDGAVSHRFEGRIHGESMTGVLRSGFGPRQVQGRWHAKRVSNAMVN